MLFYRLIGARQERGWYKEADCLCRLQIYD